MTIVDVSGPILGRGPLFCQFSYKATTKSSYSGWLLTGGLTVFTMCILLRLGKMREVQRFLSRICAHKVKRVLRWN